MRRGCANEVLGWLGDVAEELDVRLHLLNRRIHVRFKCALDEIADERWELDRSHERGWGGWGLDPGRSAARRSLVLRQRRRQPCGARASPGAWPGGLGICERRVAPRSLGRAPDQQVRLVLGVVERSSTGHLAATLRLGSRTNSRPPCALRGMSSNIAVETAVLCPQNAGCTALEQHPHGPRASARSRTDGGTWPGLRIAEEDVVSRTRVVLCAEGSAIRRLPPSRQAADLRPQTSRPQHPPSTCPQDGALPRRASTSHRLARLSEPTSAATIQGWACPSSSPSGVPPRALVVPRIGAPAKVQDTRGQGRRSKTAIKTIHPAIDRESDAPSPRAQPRKTSSPSASDTASDNANGFSCVVAGSLRCFTARRRTPE